MLTPNLKAAIIEFIKDEYRLEPNTITEDLSFTTDLGLDPASVLDLLNRMQEALDFTLPEEKSTDLKTLEDLFLALDADQAGPPDTSTP